MDKIEATRAKYIKLGKGGAYEDASIKEGKLCLGFGYVNHSIGKDRDKIIKYLVGEGYKLNTASTIAGQVVGFYTEPKDTLWITFSDDFMYWCRAEEEVLGYDPDPKPDIQGNRYRKVIGEWSNKDIKGKPLKMAELSGKLTQTAGYRGTICELRSVFDYLLCKINGEKTEEVKKAEKAKEGMNNPDEEAKKELLDSICGLMRTLHPKDFELLVDFVFAREGKWDRISGIGGVQKFIDIEMQSSSGGKRAMVQVKSKTTKEDIEDHICTFKEKYNHIDKFFFVYHTGEKFQIDNQSDNFQLINGEELAEMILAVDKSYWIFNWLLKKAS